MQYSYRRMQLCYNFLIPMMDQGNLFLLQMEQDCYRNVFLLEFQFHSSLYSGRIHSIHSIVHSLEIMKNCLSINARWRAYFKMHINLVLKQIQTWTFLRIASFCNCSCSWAYTTIHFWDRFPSIFRSSSTTAWLITSRP